mgnify:CR=1 FL=1
MTYFLIWCGLGIVGAMISKDKGNSGCGGFILGALLGPIGLLMAFFTPENQEEKRRMSGDTKQCPYCAEYVKEDAIICKHCRSRLDNNQSNSGFDIEDFRQN